MSVLEKIKTIKEFVLDLLFPIECLGCGKEKVWLCGECLKKIPLNRGFACPVCGEKSVFGKTCPECAGQSPLDGLLSASFYGNKLLRSALQSFKYKYVTDLSVPLGWLMSEYLRRLPAQLLEELLTYTIVPVPLHRKKLLERGFNQSKLLAKELAKAFNFKIDAGILIRQKNTSPQANKKERKRQANVEDAFACACEAKDGKSAAKTRPVPAKIILLDDVATSGSTLQSAAQALKAAGAKEVWGLTLARG